MADQTVGTEQWLAEFQAKAEPLGVTVLHEGNSSSAARAAAAWVQSLGTDSLMVVSELAERAPDLADELARAGLRLTDPVPPAEMRDTPVGVSLATMAIAETGSTLLAEQTLEDRAIGMLCLSQIIVCSTDSLVGTLDVAAPELRRLALSGVSAMATLVTGPSRTADIERTLTVGVQGPGKVMVLLVDDLA